jgi:hypothetical protein
MCRWWWLLLDEPAVGETEFCAVVRCTFDDLEITGSEVVACPYRW